jgi:hypothetical protein
MIDMSLSQPAGQSQPSWSTATSSTEPKHPQWSRFLERTGWFEIGFTVVALGIYDFMAFFLGGLGINEARCPGGNCGGPNSKSIPLPTQLQILHDSYWLIPVLLALPLLVGLFLRRWLVLMVVVQVVVCAFLMTHIVSRAHLVDDRIHGRVPCWNIKYTPTNCPWDGR